MRYISSVIVVAALWSCSQVQSVSFDPRVSRGSLAALDMPRYVVTVDCAYGF